MIYNLLEEIQKKLIEIESNTVYKISSILLIGKRNSENITELKTDIKALKWDIADLKKEVARISQK